MRLLLQYVTAAQLATITAGNTKREIDSLVWCVEHQPEHLRREYLNAFCGGEIGAELAAFMGIRELVKA